jgi:hypothetical protein
MHEDHTVTASNRSLYREWALTQPREASVERSRAPRRVRGTGPWLAAAPMLAVCGLTIAAALIIGATAKATAALSRPTGFQIAGAEQMRRQAQAAQAFQARQYAMAYGRFAELADAGDPPSALMALSMVRHGPSIFGSQWSATPAQLQRWSTLALQDVREHSVQIAEHDRGE